MPAPQVVAARKYLGVKFRHRGRSSTGLDCVGLVMRSWYDCGVKLHDYLLYGRDPCDARLQEHAIAAMGEPVAIAPVAWNDLQDGDVVILRFVSEPHHVGIVAAVEYAGQPAFNLIHADGMAGRVIEQRISEDMRARITHVHRRPV